MAYYRKSAVPAERSSQPQVRTKQRLLVTILLAILILSPATAAYVFTRPAPVVPPTGDLTPPKAIALADEAGRDFLASRNTRVAAVEGLDTEWAPKSATSAQLAAAAHPVQSFAYGGATWYTVGDKQPTKVWRIRFRVAMAGATYFLDVPVMEAGGSLGYLLAETPALVPAPGGGTSFPALDYNKLYDSEGVNGSAVQAAATKWLTAYLSEGTNSATLREVTRDFSKTRRYDGMPGWKGEVLSVTSSYAVTNQGPEKPAGVIAQVRVALTPTATNGAPLKATYDLYVEQNDKETEWPVIAWGPAGSGPGLKRYENALTAN